MDAVVIHAGGETGAAERQEGFTLVEVLVAFTIIALTLTMGLRVLAEGAQWARRGPAQAARVEEAASVMNGLVADPGLATGEVAGVFSDGAPWVARVDDVTALLVPGGKTRLFRIALFAGSPAGPPVLVTLAAAAK